MKLTLATYDTSTVDSGFDITSGLAAPDASLCKKQGRRKEDGRKEKHVFKATLLFELDLLDLS